MDREKTIFFDQWLGARVDVFFLDSRFVWLLHINNPWNTNHYSFIANAFLLQTGIVNNLKQASRSLLNI